MKFDVYSTSEYFADITARIERTGQGDTVMLATMVFFPQDAGVKQLIDALRAAARRGAQATLLVDANNFMIQRGRHLGPLFLHDDFQARVPRAFRPAYYALEEMKQAGVRCFITNRPAKAFSSPIAGRSHIKYGVVNERVYVGGCNLDHSTNIDLMTGWDDAQSSKWLSELADATIASGSVKAAMQRTDAIREIAPGAELLIDAGVAGQSLIFERALHLIDGARERVTLTCQFFPNDLTTQYLLGAHRRGVKVKILYNRPSKHLFPHTVLHLGVETAAKLQLPKSFFEHVLDPSRPYLHAKLITTERGIMIGSHNFLQAGVSLGTAEIALLSSDAGLGMRLEAAIMKEISPR